MEKFDLVIVGGGILGTSVAYWTSLLYEGRIAVLETEKSVAVHTSGRNTGVIHRPFYLDPEKRKFFASSAQISYELWKKYAVLRRLPWNEIGTLEVATEPNQLKVLEKYSKWARANGMNENEIEICDEAQVQKLEPNLNCLGALLCRTDTSVDFKAFTENLKQDAAEQGAQFVFGFDVGRVEAEREQIRIFPSGSAAVLAGGSEDESSSIESVYLLNCSGGNAVDIAHRMGFGAELTDLHFRGEYWEIAPEQANLASRNIYSVPRHTDLPFLDPHWIVRAGGKREIGPNAVLVAGCKTYDGFFSDLGELFGKICESPVKNKLNLLVNPEFLKLASEEWRSSISKSAMAKRVQRFIPKLHVEHLLRRGTAGIRSSVIDSQGNFLKEAVEISGPLSYHILNYNSPGATGAPAYAAALVKKLEKNGALSHLKKRKNPKESFWNFTEIVSRLQS